MNQIYNNNESNSEDFEIDNNNHDEISNSSFDMKSEESINIRKPPPRQKTEEEILQEKQELLYRLERFEKSGSQPSKKFTMNSKFEDIKFEYDRIKNQRDIDKSIKFQRKVLMALTSGIEFLNGKFDPFNIKLDGWSESIYENVNDYDEAEELHEKYKEK